MRVKLCLWKFSKSVERAAVKLLEIPEHWTIQYGALHCTVVHCGAVQFIVVQFISVQCSVDQCHTVQLSVVQCSRVQWCEVLCSAMQFRAGQSCEVQSNAVRGFQFSSFLAGSQWEDTTAVQVQVQLEVATAAAAEDWLQLEVLQGRPAAAAAAV